MVKSPILVAPPLRVPHGPRPQVLQLQAVQEMTVRAAKPMPEERVLAAARGFSSGAFQWNVCQSCWMIFNPIDKQCNINNMQYPNRFTWNINNQK